MNVGFGKQEISPDKSCSLIGYTQRADLHGAGNDGILDPLYCRAIAFENEGGVALLISFDLCILEDPLIQLLCDHLSGMLDIPAEHILLSATHTHSGPYPWRPDWSSGAREFVPELLYEDPSQDYLKRLQNWTVVAARAAIDTLAPATFRTRTCSCGIAYTRRVHTENGVEMCWNPKERPDLKLKPAADDRLVLLEIHREQRPSILVFNCAGHPVVLGKGSNQVSADWPGTACRLIEEQNPDTHALFLHGAGGDAHPWLATDTCPEDLIQVATPVASQVSLLVHSGGEASSDQGLAMQSVEVALKMTTLSFHLWQIGPVTLLGFPGELFGSTGLDLRSRCPTPLLIATTTQGWKGYVPPEKAFSETAYELEAVSSFHIAKGDAERIVEAVTQSLTSLLSRE